LRSTVEVDASNTSGPLAAEPEYTLTITVPTSPTSVLVTLPGRDATAWVRPASRMLCRPDAWDT
jgi:hypothetical protein